MKNLPLTDLPATFRWANLTEVRSTLVTGALLSRSPGPTVVLARHVAGFSLDGVVEDHRRPSHFLRL